MHFPSSSVDSCWRDRVWNPYLGAHRMGTTSLSVSNTLPGGRILRFRRPEILSKLTSMPTSAFVGPNQGTNFGPVPIPGQSFCVNGPRAEFWARPGNGLEAIQSLSSQLRGGSGYVCLKWRSVRSARLRLCRIVPKGVLVGVVTASNKSSRMAMT